MRAGNDAEVERVTGWVQPAPGRAASWHPCSSAGGLLAASSSGEDATRRRLALLVRAGELFHRSLDLRETLSNVARTAVESFADLCLVDLIDERTSRLYLCLGAHRDPEIEEVLADLVTPLLQAETRRTHPARQVSQTGTTFFVPVFDEQTLLEHASSAQHEAFMRRMKYRSRSSFRCSRGSEFSARLRSCAPRMPSRLTPQMQRPPKSWAGVRDSPSPTRRSTLARARRSSG